MSSKLRAYKNKAQCRVDLEKAFDEREKEVGERDEQLVQMYQFYVDMAPHAWDAYQAYRSHPAWRGKRLRRN